MNLPSVWAVSVPPTSLPTPSAGRARARARLRPTGSEWRVGAARPAGVALQVGTAPLAAMPLRAAKPPLAVKPLLVAMPLLAAKPLLAAMPLLVAIPLLAAMPLRAAGSQTGAPAPLPQSAPPVPAPPGAVPSPPAADGAGVASASAQSAATAAATAAVPVSPRAEEGAAASLASTPAEELQAESELPPLRPLDRLIERMDPNHVDAVGLAFIAGQAAALLHVLGAQAEQDAASWQQPAASAAAQAGDRAHAAPAGVGPGEAVKIRPAAPAGATEGAAAREGGSPGEVTDAGRAGDEGAPVDPANVSRAEKARMAAVHFRACAADFEWVARWLTFSHDLQDLDQRDAQQAEFEALYLREAEEFRAARLGHFPPSMRRDYDAAMKIHSDVKTLADHWRSKVAERAAARASGKDREGN